ncbi:hypothetical protein Cgig2_008162 [Carnegiea gigantea]|uniref:Uncharacterized protein n=1 Tax=Carnegiea gigantea TaxID=171969 RepID=A0A9Q1L152_9CARY|nr:hypothetical protein Cgig2_008162 [Carnegiea gigantea]
MVIDENTLAKWIVKNLPMVKKVVFDSCWIFPCVLRGVFLYGINVKELYFTKCGLPVGADVSYRLDQLDDPDRLVENFALSWTECNGGCPSWHPVFTSNDDTSAIRSRHGCVKKCDVLHVRLWQVDIKMSEIPPNPFMFIFSIAVVTLRIFDIGAVISN